MHYQDIIPENLNNTFANTDGIIHKLVRVFAFLPAACLPVGRRQARLAP
jgi:hypothetical protein